MKSCLRVLPVTMLLVSSACGNSVGLTTGAGDPVPTPTSTATPTPGPTATATPPPSCSVSVAPVQCSPTSIVIHHDVYAAYPSDLAGVVPANGQPYCVDGKVVLTPFFTDLTALQGLREVTGLLSINKNQNLTSLHGLESLEAAQEILLQGNPKLSDLSGLDHLKVVGNGLELDDIDKVTTFQGAFDSLQVVGGLGLYVNNAGGTQPMAADLDGFPALQGVRDFHVTQAPGLKKLSGFQNLTCIDGKLSLYYDPDLPQCEAQAFAAGRIVMGDQMIGPGNAPCP